MSAAVVLQVTVMAGAVRASSNASTVTALDVSFITSRVVTVRLLSGQMQMHICHYAGPAFGIWRIGHLIDWWQFYDT